MRKIITLQAVRIGASGAAVGAVIFGLLFGNIGLSFDPRAVGATVGALAYMKLFHII